MTPKYQNFVSSIQTQVIRGVLCDSTKYMHYNNNAGVELLAKELDKKMQDAIKKQNELLVKIQEQNAELLEYNRNWNDLFKSVFGEDATLDDFIAKKKDNSN